MSQRMLNLTRHFESERGVAHSCVKAPRAIRIQYPFFTSGCGTVTVPTTFSIPNIRQFMQESGERGTALSCVTNKAMPRLALTHIA